MAKDLPTAEEVWARVCNFAEQRKRDKQKVHTLARKVGNRIVYVDEVRIRRYSDEGTRQTSDIMRSHVEGVWQELTRQQWASTKGHDRVFTHALMWHALPEFIMRVDGSTIRLHIGGPSQSAQPLALDSDESDDARTGRRGGGEGPLHRALRMYIYEEPDDALARLPGGPWKPYETEYQLETQDRIDVVLQDKKGTFTLIEVKPKLVSDREYRKLDSTQLSEAIAPFAQAAKYRTQWQVLYDVPLEQIHCVVAAPTIPKQTLSQEMFHRHTIESVDVKLPKNRVL